MKRIICEDCKRAYDFERDDFCPRCGAFNPPVKTWGVDGQGNVVRVDGVNEENHGASFVHREVHREKAVRRALGMDWNKAKAARRPMPPSRRQPESGAQAGSRNRALIWAAVIVGFFSLVMPLLAELIGLLFS